MPKTIAVCEDAGVVAFGVEVGVVLFAISVEKVLLVAGAETGLVDGRDPKERVPIRVLLLVLAVLLVNVNYCKKLATIDTFVLRT